MERASEKLRRPRDYSAQLISLNPRLCEHGADEIDRTLRHELAHLLAQFRAGRRRILPHGAEWREACRDLGIADEKRCHTLPFCVTNRARRVSLSLSPTVRAIFRAFAECGARLHVWRVAGRTIGANSMRAFDFDSGIRLLGRVILSEAKSASRSLRLIPAPRRDDALQFPRPFGFVRAVSPG